MAENTAIQWATDTWNPWQGCHKVSAGCDHCYMEREKKRYGQDPSVVGRSMPKTFNLPLALAKKYPEGGRRVFTCSWSDFFIEEADEWRVDAWNVILHCPDLIFQF